MHFDLVPGFDFTEIFEQLSALSADISRRMKTGSRGGHHDPATAPGVVRLSPKKGENPKPVPKMGRRDLSLRQVGSRSDMMDNYSITN